MEAKHRALVDRKSEQSIRDLYNLYSKDDTHVKQAEVLFMFLEKNLLSNKLTFDDISIQYRSVAAEETAMTFPNFLVFFQAAARIVFPQTPDPTQALIHACANEKARFRNWKGLLIRGVPNLLFR
jgi:hypothetical protein